MIKTGKAGSGTYGVVYNAKTPDKTGKETDVAVKRNIIDNGVSFSGSIKELDLLNRLRGHPYIVKLISVSFGSPFSTPNSPIGEKLRSKFREDYLHFVFEKAEMNLHSAIYEKGVPVSYLKLTMVQLLLGVEYMHSKNVMHRDIKPANLLWFNKEDKISIKFCDFGLSKIKTEQEPSTPRVVTCWYRAPEICARLRDYSYKSDIWSVGCIFYEIAARRPLLMGLRDDDSRLLNAILELYPEWSEYVDDLIKIAKKNKLKIKEKFKVQVPSWRGQIGLDEEEVENFDKYPGNGATYDEFIDLLNGLLEINPERRYSATEALKHDFFKPYSEFISWSRSLYPPEMKEEPLIKIINCIERKWASKIAFVVFNGREGLEWYKHRIIFQSIDLFDRYLNYLDSKMNKQDEIDVIKETKYVGRYMTRYETQLRYVVCLYMCIKYFTTLVTPISFEDLATDEYKTYKALIAAEEFEQKMLKDVIRFKMYRETIYEAADRLGANLNEYQIRDMLLGYGTMESIGDIVPTELLNRLNIIL